MAAGLAPSGAHRPPAASCGADWPAAPAERAASAAPCGADSSAAASACIGASAATELGALAPIVSPPPLEPPGPLPIVPPEVGPGRWPSLRGCFKIGVGTAARWCCLTVGAALMCLELQDTPDPFADLRREYGTPTTCWTEGDCERAGRACVRNCIADADNHHPYWVDWCIEKCSRLEQECIDAVSTGRPWPEPPGFPQWPDPPDKWW